MGNVGFFKGFWGWGFFFRESVSAMDNGNVGVLITIIGMANESEGIEEVGDGD